LTPVSDSDVFKLIANLRPDTASGYDGIHPKVIKHCSTLLLKPLKHIANTIMAHGDFPDKLKKARVTVIWKGASKSDLGNYRPISVLSVFSKIFESIICMQMYDYVEENTILTTQQYGFRRNRSTEQALLKIKEKILSCFEKSEYIVGIFFDIRKAFDSLCHEILLMKLEQYGIRGTALQLIKNYLTSRTQYVHINEHVSTLETLLYGVPQGSNLGPLLFILFINDFVNIYSADFTIFADDTNAFIKGSNLDHIAEQCNELCNNALLWSRTNSLSLNIQKTKAMIFRAKNKPMSEISIKLDGMPIEIVDNIKFLGVVFALTYIGMRM
jgi:hypothetical protein